MATKLKKLAHFYCFPLLLFEYIFNQLVHINAYLLTFKILFLYQFKISVNSENIYRHRYGPINGSFDIRNVFFFMTFLFLISLSTNFLANHVIADTTGFVDRLMSIWQVNRKSQDWDIYGPLVRAILCLQFQGYSHLL